MRRIEETRKFYKKLKSSLAKFKRENTYLVFFRFSKIYNKEPLKKIWKK